ncbi:YdcF family protein [Streptomyces caniscabiei]|uniref:YdcF family protein n=1 Tax=Streptomyces caniscabiei TaxID=2746961 RepID=UPI0029B2FA95|nr:YdcF family protein [Streptomyces caniscabiei]MDX2776606.1 YdcF family protein [Streptomyces caniscabiei]
MKPEAKRYKDILIALGVPAQAVITEDKSITIPDNVRHSLTLLKERQIHFDSITIVNSPYAQRRGWAILKKRLPQHVKVYRVNSDCADIYKKENWYKQEETLRVVLNEFVKMRASVVYNTA